MEYIKGRRKYYASPIAVLLGVSFIYLVLFKLDFQVPIDVEIQFELPMITKMRSAIILDTTNNLLLKGDVASRRKDSLLIVLLQQAFDLDDSCNSLSCISNNVLLFELHELKLVLEEKGIDLQDNIFDSIVKLQSELPKSVMVYNFFLLFVYSKKINEPVDSILYDLNAEGLANSITFQLAQNIYKNVNNTSMLIYNIYNYASWLFLFMFPFYALLIYPFYKKSGYNIVEITLFLYYLQSSFILFLIFSSVLGFISGYLGMVSLLLSVIWFIILLDLSWTKFFSGSKIWGRIKLYVIAIPLYLGMIALTFVVSLFISIIA